MIQEILKNLSSQIFFTVGIIIILGIVIWISNRVFYKNIGEFGKIACITTGIIGTPIHELGHVFFCIIFGHRILEIRLFQPNSNDGTLGYVNHTFNKRNIYHQIGNFFIGIGPIIFGTGTLILLMYLLMPNLLIDLNREVNNFPVDSKLNIFSKLWTFVTIFFYQTSLTNPGWWIYLVLACGIALHMNLSIPDIKASLIGFIYIIIILFFINVTLYLINVEIVNRITNWSIYISTYILNFLMISTLLSLILILVAILFRAIKVLIEKLNK